VCGVCVCVVCVCVVCVCVSVCVCLSTATLIKAWEMIFQNGNVYSVGNAKENSTFPINQFKFLPAALHPP